MKKEKENRYIEAYKRIDSSIESQHYFEAITIEESILNDRISSFIEANDSLSQAEIHRQSFNQLIILWKISTSTPGCIWDSCLDLINKVDKWRKKRNEFVHGLVKFPNNKANLISTESFIEDAKKTALEGKELSRLVSEWREKQIVIKRNHNRENKRTMNFPYMCENCEVTAHNKEEIINMFGVRSIVDGGVIGQSWCRDCRNKILSN
ncbi:hypothetical protein ACIPT2_06185 [Pectobacterium brasiliense]|uniref:hypothetical protein n=1 Tax=Pectobacterium brasiliense TaxID=180957 RepID=UPI0038202986